MRLASTLMLLMFTLMVAGCATTGTPESDAQHAARQSAVSAGEKGAVKGCAGGAVVGLLRSGSVGGAVKGCVIGGAFVGIATGVERYHRQMEVWRQFAAHEQSAGVRVELLTTTVVVHEGGKDTSTPAPKSMTIQLIAADVVKHGQPTQALLRRTASLADASTMPITIAVAAPKSERPWLAGQLRAGLRPATTATVRELPARVPALVLTPAPVIGG